MNVKEYIDQFKEISHLDRHQQFVVLEQARYEAFVTLKLSKVTLLSFVVPVLLFIFIATLGYFSFGYSSWLPLVIVVLTVVISRIIMSKINRAILSKGLQRVLARDTEATAQG